MPDSVQTILIVDDDPNIRETAKDILEDDGYRVATAGTCAEALSQLAAAAVETAIIDFNLPDGKGLELAAQVKKNFPRLRIILMTGETTLDLSQAQGIVQAVLTKPVNPGDLLRLLHTGS